MMEDLADAWDAFESKESDDAVQQVSDTSAPEAELPADESDSTDELATDGEVVSAGEGESGEAETGAEDGTPAIGEAPKSLSPAAREAWGDVPDAVKERGRGAVAAYLAPYWAASIRRELDEIL